LSKPVPSNTTSTGNSNQVDRIYLSERDPTEELRVISGFLGGLSSLLDDDTISEIMINNFQRVFVEKEGRLKAVKFQYRNHQEVFEIIQKIAQYIGRSINMEFPTLDARLPDGSRVHAVIPPLAVDGPCLTIRKFPKDRLTYKKLLDNGTWDERIAYFLQSCVKAKVSMLISGGTGSGKTSLLNVLSGFIPAEERIVTIEDAAELRLEQINLVRLETRPQAVTGFKDVTIRDLVRNALRMRPDRIIVGECRGDEAFDMLQAMNTGHEGSMSTIHANTARDCLSRLESLTLMANGNLPLLTVRKHIQSSVNLIIQISRMPDGSRKVTEIAELVGMESGVITSQPIFRFEEKGWTQGKLGGSFINCGNVPTFLPKFRLHNVQFPKDFFTDEYEVKLR